MACGCGKGKTSPANAVALRYTGTGALPKVFVAPSTKRRFLVNEKRMEINVPTVDVPGFLAMTGEDKFQKVVA